ncbi:spermidine synthase [Clostridium kluyveri]|uniref:Spermidine synthase n=1 Tax=Clostridium kluyveri TaxID=1534 RepID=A0A1L5F9V5_CLOKL|nr:fused MFS/spermidine synthase [Clostridium kluyveri]APM39772.1 spermidine synthase [Clostridium kluyveri]UZQ50069.1 fused MFS/spermidine synthase [Clostridium kluyveri]
METRTILKNKFYLYMTEFFAGMSVMAVELGASRLLAPYFSSSQIVWTIIIGTIMIAMALGNIWGGKSADKNPNPDKLYMRMIIAAIWIAAIPLLGKYIILAVSAALVLTISNNFLILATFLTCMIIFVFPLFLLGTVTPSLVKYTVNSLSDNGKIVGMLGAVNTIGSIIGTFLPTFVTIPAVGTSVTFLIFSGILLVLGMIYFINIRAKKVQCIISIILFIFCSVFGSSDSFAFWEKDLLYEGESIYNYLQVKDTNDSVILSTNVLFGVQSIMKKDNGFTGMYYDYALAAPVMSGIHKKKNAKILVLGMGTGTYAKQCQKYFPNASIEGVEIDQKITNLASKYFKLPNTIKVNTYDGRAYLNSENKKYDVIMVDAYQDITIPFQMSSKEFFTIVKNHLVEDGIMVVNMNMHTEKKGNITQHLSDTIANVFNEVYTVDVDGSTNRELFATKNMEAAKTFEQNTRGLRNNELKTLMYNIADNMDTYVKGNYLLTDDKAPVELLGMRVIDELIQDELSYYKKIFKEKYKDLMIQGGEINRAEAGGLDFPN